MGESDVCEHRLAAAPPAAHREGRAWLGQFAAQVLEVGKEAEDHGQLIHRDSAESPDGDDELKAMLEELLARTEKS